MYKIAGKVIDFLDDAALAENAEVRALVDPHLHADKHAQLPDSDFALVLRGVDRHGKFPVYNKVAANLSLKWFAHHAENLHPVFRAVTATFLQKAAKEYSLPQPSNLAKYAVAGLRDNVIDLEQMGDEHIAETFNKHALFDRMQQFWLENERYMQPDELNSKADKLEKLASELSRKVHSRVWEYVTKTGAGPKLRVAINQRVKTAGQLGNDTAAEEFRALLQNVGEVKTVVAALAALDKKHEMHRYYSRMADPYKAAYGGTDQTKVADIGMEYKLITFAKERYDDLHAILSREGVEAFQFDPLSTFQKLPKPIQDYITAKMDSVFEKRTGSIVAEHVELDELQRRTKSLKQHKSEYAPFGPHTVRGRRPGKRQHAVGEYQPIGEGTKIPKVEHVPSNKSKPAKV